MLARNLWRIPGKTFLAIALAILLGFSLLPSDRSLAAPVRSRSTKVEQAKNTKLSGRLSEVSPPPGIQELGQILEGYQPQVSILSPRPDEVLSETTASVRFQVRDLPVFKDAKLGLGPHLHVFLDNQPYQAVYDLTQPITLSDLTPGTHTLRVFASRPWHESFKNEGAYAQTTFHVLTKTQENAPNPNLPLLTYSRPQGSYGAEPIMLDFYLTNAPLHLVAQADAKDDIADWRIRCTINGESFILDRWQPVYLKGFKPGQNWLQLEFLDEKGEPVANAFNNTARLITYEPNGQDTLAKLVRGDLSAADARGIVDPSYVPPEPIPAPSPSPEPVVIPSPEPVVPVPSPTPIVPSPQVETPPTVPTPVPIPVPAPEPNASPEVAPPPEVAVPETSKPTPVKAPKARKVKSREAQPSFLERFRSKPQPSSTPAPSPTPSPELVPEIEPEPPASVLESPAPPETAEETIAPSQPESNQVPVGIPGPSPAIAPEIPAKPEVKRIDKPQDFVNLLRRSFPGPRTPAKPTQPEMSSPAASPTPDSEPVVPSTSPVEILESPSASTESQETL